MLTNFWGSQFQCVGFRFRYSSKRNFECNRFRWAQRVKQ